MNKVKKLNRKTKPIEDFQWEQLSLIEEASPRRVIHINEDSATQINKIISGSNSRTVSKKNNEALERKRNLAAVFVLNDKIALISKKRRQVEQLIEDSQNKETITDSFKKFFRSFFDSCKEDKELEAMRNELRERLECIGIEDISFDGLVQVLRDVLSEREDTYNRIKTKVENNLLRVKVIFDFRHRIRHFIDKMYRYSNSDDEEGKSYMNSQLMNSKINLYPLENEIKNRNVGVFRLHPSDTRMGSKAA